MGCRSSNKPIGCLPEEEGDLEGPLASPGSGCSEGCHTSCRHREPSSDLSSQISWMSSTGARAILWHCRRPQAPGRHRLLRRPDPHLPLAFPKRQRLRTCSATGRHLRPRVRTADERPGTSEILIAPRAPWQNPFAERVIGSIRRECLDHVIVINERHLRCLLRTYLVCYNADPPAPGPPQQQPPSARRATARGRAHRWDSAGRELHHRDQHAA